MPDERSKLVYSTEQAISPKEKPIDKSSRSTTPPAQQKVTVRLDRKGRGGKSVTVIEGLQMQQRERETLLKQFKAQLGTGGTVKDASIEIQGDHRVALMAALEEKGYRPKRSGG